MSNPFDQFAADFQAALPAGAPSAPPPAEAAPAYDPNASLMAQPPAPAAAPKPVMNAPVMNQPGGYGAPPQGGGYGQQPQYGMQQPPMQQSMGSMGGGMQQPMNSMNGSMRQSMNGGMGMSMNSMGQPGGPPPANFGGIAPSGSFGGYDPSASAQGMPPAGAPPGAPPAYGAPAPDSSNPFGAPAPPAADNNMFGAPPPAAAPPAADASNPFGAPAPQPGYGAPPPGNQGGFGAPPAPPGGQPGYGAPPPSDGGFGGQPPQRASFVASAPGQDFGAPPSGAPDFGGGYGAPAPQDPGFGAPAQPPADPSMGALVPAQQQSNPYAQYGAPPPAAPPAAPGNDPYGAAPSYGAPAPPQGGADQYADPWGAPPGAPPQQQQSSQALTPYGAPPGAPPPQQQYQQQQATPYGAPPPGNPYGAPPPQQQQMTPYGGPPAADPFSVFEQQSAPAPPPAPVAAPAPQQALVPAAPAQASDNLWGDLGFDAPPAAEPPAPAPEAIQPSHSDEKKTGDGSLPPGGEYYDARIFTPTLGVMFFKPQELTDSLFLNTDQSIVDGLVERPVVAFIVEGSSARAAGVELGHVLLKVNGVDVKNPKEASRLIKEGPRPLPLLFYVPNTDVVVAEGEHMVKYDTRETTAPNSAKDWKPKYVVIGGIIAQPWMMNMYRSKSEYDIAVIETQARRPVSVKVKQFSLQGARIQNDWQGPQMVKYKNKIHPWKYIVVLPVARNPIKISSPNLAQLKPSHEGIRRVLLAQNRDRSYNSQGAEVRQPRNDRGHHSQGHNGHHDHGYHGQQQVQQYHGQQQQYNY